MTSSLRGKALIYSVSYLPLRESHPLPFHPFHLGIPSPSVSSASLFFSCCCSRLSLFCRLRTWAFPLISPCWYLLSFLLFYSQSSFIHLLRLLVFWSLVSISIDLPRERETTINAAHSSEREREIILKGGRSWSTWEHFHLQYLWPSTPTIDPSLRPIIIIIQMGRQRVISSFILLFSLALLCSADPTVKTEYGEVVGFEFEEADVFLGVPYAAPPLGELRFTVSLLSTSLSRLSQIVVSEGMNQ